MILLQKAQLVKYLAAVISSFIILYSVHSEEQSLEMQNSSPFNVLGEDVYSFDASNMDIVKQPIVKGELESLNLARVRILESSTGNSYSITLKLGKDFELDDAKITLKKCQRDKKEILNPISMALISIEKKEETIFNGWIFSQNPSISLPAISDKYIYITRCEKQE